MSRHVGVRVPENLGQHVDGHAVFDGHAGEGVAGTVGGQHLVDAAHGRDFLHVGVHPLVARRREHPGAGEARLVVLVAAQDFECGRKQRDAAHHGCFLAGLVNPPAPLVVLREVFAPQVVGVGECQSRQAAEDEDVADAGQPVVELLVGQQFQFVRREVFFGLHLVFLELVVAERIFRNPLVAQAVEDEVAQTVHDGNRPVVAAAVSGLQEEVEAVQELVVHPLDGNVFGLAAPGEILFQVAQQPFVLVGRTLRDAYAHLALPPLRVVGKARDEHHRVAGRVQVALLDLRSIGRIAFGQQFGADVDDFDAEIVQSLVDLNGQLVRPHRTLLVLVPRFGIAVALGVDLLPEPSGRNTCEDGRQPVLFRSSFSHQEKDGKCLLSHDVEILGVNKTPAREIYCDVKRSKTAHYSRIRERALPNGSFLGSAPFRVPASLPRTAFRFRFGKSTETFAK